VSVKVQTLWLGSIGCVGKCTVDAADKDHPNKSPFSGVLLILDSPSNKPPHGAEGHRILVPTSVAKKRLKTLINMGLNYSPELDSHAPRHKVGVITGAWIDGKKLMVRGFIWKKDFPEAEKDLHAGKIGMSMELANVYVRSKDDDVWYLEDFHFSGATALFKSAAAYQSTALAAAAARARTGGSDMKTKEKGRSVAAGGDQSKLLVMALGNALGPIIQKSIEEGFKPLTAVIEKQGRSLRNVSAAVEGLKVAHIEAAKDADEEEVEIEAEGDDKEEDKEETEIEADADENDEEDDGEDDGKKKKMEDDDDEDDDAELDAQLEHLAEDEAEEKPGEFNKDAKNEGEKTTRTGKIGKEKHMAVKASSIHATSSLIRELYASHRAQRTKLKTLRAASQKKIESLENKIEALNAQVEQYAERVDRRSLPAELTNFLAKGGHDVRELFASGKKLSVAEVDEIFASSPHQLDVTTRMWFKNQLLDKGLMEQGEVVR
jgi:hypothetical protein